MRVIKLKTLKEFWTVKDAFADAEGPIRTWYYEVVKAKWTSPSDVKEQFRSASILKGSRVVFNIAGNKYRLVVKINYPAAVVYVRFVGTHAQYDRIDAETV